MGKKLVIVESPAKAKTINKFLGKDFEVTSSFGHIRDLPSSGLAIDLKNNYEPEYEISPDKIKTVRELQALAKNADDVYLATDEDREGEAIAWHLCSVLNLNPKTTKRITYTEITEKAVKTAVENPRTLNLNLVNAQQARRVLDRLVGYELSPVLWKKVKPSLSAGRVQSVAVRLIVEREREINQFASNSYFKISALFEVKDGGKTTLLKAESNSRPQTESVASAYLTDLIGAAFSVKGTEKKPTRRTPSAPFTTSTLQQEASRKLSFSVSKTMTVAQRLYEAGHITYMRTDSNSLSEVALHSIGAEINNKFGARYHKRRQYTTKNQSAQEAHEAIRPSYIGNVEVSGDRDEQRLYELIWKRTIASQMSDAELEKTIITIQNNRNANELHATGEVVLFDGFLKVYSESVDDENDSDDENSVLLPPLKNGMELPLRELTAIERFTRPQPRYTEASLVKKLEELGIGRPSTYAPTISTIQQRGYVVKENRDGVKRNYVVLTLADNKVKSQTKSEITGAEKMKLFPTDIGGVVTDFLVENFGKVLDYHFTANVEKQFDEIAEGKKEWYKMIDGFYRPFHSNIEETTNTAQRATGERLLGNHPETGESVIARIGRFGAMVQIGSGEGEGKPRYASLTAQQSIETVTLEEALELFKLPRILGEYEQKEISVNIGRFGAYVKWGESFISLPKDEDVMSVSLNRAVEVIKEKQTADAPVASYKGKPITKGKGRFGPFIKWNEMFINVPRAYDLDNLTQEQMFELIEKKIEKESNRYIQQWENEKIAIENGRWGAFIRFGKAMVKIGRKKDGEKYANEELAKLSLDEVKKLIEAELPDAFAKKAAKTTKKATKSPSKKATAKKK